MSSHFELAYRRHEFPIFLFDLAQQIVKFPGILLLQQRLNR